MQAAWAAQTPQQLVRLQTLPPHPWLSFNPVAYAAWAPRPPPSSWVDCKHLTSHLGLLSTLLCRLPGLPDPPSSWVDWADACLTLPACKPLQMPLTAEQVRPRVGGEGLLDFRELPLTSSDGDLS